MRGADMIASVFRHGNCLIAALPAEITGHAVSL
jgi:hypothetical protein